MKVETRVPGRAGTRISELVETVRALERWGTSRDWVGTDPYEALNATRFAGPLRGTTTGRKVLTQLVKRSPLDLRPLLGIPRAESSAAIAAVVSAYARNGFLPPDEAEAKLQRFLGRLDALRCDGFADPCWGYHFDVQTRVFFYRRGAPNTIATAFAGLALVDAYESIGDERLLEQAVAVCDFFVRHVPQTPAQTGAYFGYLVGDRTPIHNANMLVCALFARTSAHAGRDDLFAAADAGVAYALAHQEPEGAWPYGELSNLRWIDGFHTGYVLEALSTCVRAGIPSADPVALRRGLDFYRFALFRRDGTPKYTTRSTYPIDIQCVAQAIQTFAIARDPWAWHVFRFALEHMRRPDGAFVFQRRRLWTNATPHIRWGQAPMLLALTHLLQADG